MSTHYPEWYSQNGEDLIVWCSEDIYDAWGLDTELLTSQDEEAQDQDMILLVDQTEIYRYSF